MENMCIYVLNIDGLMMYTKPIIYACFLKSCPGWIIDLPPTWDEYQNFCYLVCRVNLTTVQQS